MTRVCACGCGASLAGRDRRARYVDAAHRSAAWKLTNGYGRSARPAARKVRSNGQAARPRPSGLKVSYRKVAVMLEAELTRLGARNPRERAEHVLRPALSDRQRAQLDDMNARRG